MFLKFLRRINEMVFGTEDNFPRNAFKPRVQPRKPSVPTARNASTTDDDTMAGEHLHFPRSPEKRDELDEGTSPPSEALPV